MKKFLLLLILFYTCSLFAQSIIPGWVQTFRDGKPIEDVIQYYFGIGTGSDFTESDDQARSEFAKNIEIKIAKSIETILLEENEKLEEELRIKNLVSIEQTLRGIFITERFYDEESDEYLSLIRIDKEEYNQLIIRETELALKRKEEILQQQQEIRKLDDQLKEEQIKKEENEIEYQKKILELKKEKSEIKREIYEEFLNCTPPRKLISIETACHPRYAFNTDFKLRITPFRADKLDFFLALGHFEFYVGSYWQNKIYKGKDSGFRLQLIPNIGKVIKYNLSVGVLCTDFPAEAFDKSFKEMNFVPQITGTVCLPMYYSYATCHLSSTQIAVGVNNYYLFESLQEKISFIIEFKIIPKKEYRNKFGDVLLLQPGIHFQPSDMLGATFSFEENHKIIFTLEWSF